MRRIVARTGGTARPRAAAAGLISEETINVKRQFSVLPHDTGGREDAAAAAAAEREPSVYLLKLNYPSNARV